MFPNFPFRQIKDLILQIKPWEAEELEEKTMMRKRQKPTEEHVRTQDPDPASTDMMMEQMFLMMMQKQQDTEALMLK